MKGNTLHQFLDDILTMGGPEKEYLYLGKEYILQTDYNWDLKRDELSVYECFGDEKLVYICHGNSLQELYEQFVSAPIFDGRTIYEAHNDIEVLFG